MKKVMPKILVIVCAFCLLLTACGKPNPENTVSGFLKAGKTLDFETMSKYVEKKDSLKDVKEDANDKEEDYINDYIKSANSKMTYSIEKSEVKGDTATVTVKCKFIDSTDLMKAVVGEYFTKAMGAALTEGDKADTDKIMKEVFEEKLKDNKDKFTEKTIKVECVKSKDTWLIKEANDDLLDVITANMITIEKNMNDSLGEESEDESDTPEGKLANIQDWLVGDIWNDGFCNISSYVADGTSCTGEALDIDTTLEQLKKSMKAKPDYDKFINGLDDSKYADVKSAWSKLSPEIDKLYNTVSTKKPVAKDSSYKFDTGLYQQYEEVFSDAVDELS